jgi:uncharacterized phage protein gp47/JayE
MPFGLTPEGFVAKRTSDCKGELIDEYRARFGQNARVDDGAVAGQWLSMMADREADLWALLEEVYQARSISGASGEALDQHLANAGTSKQPATYSVVTLSLTGTGGTVVAAGSRSSDGTTEWIHDEDVTIPDVTTARPATAGPVVGLAGTITTRVTSIAGWTGVTNAADAELGVPVESEAQARKRAVVAFRAAGGTSFDGVGSLLLRPVTEGGAGCTDVMIVQNESDFEDADGRPPHSLEAICVGGTEDDIKAVLWASVPIGIQTWGAESTTVVDFAGNNQTVEYSRQLDIEIHMLVVYERDSEDVSFPPDTGVPLNDTHTAMGTGEEQIRDALLEAAKSRTGRDVIPFQLGQAIEVPGIRTLVVNVGLSTNPANAIPLVIAKTERAVFDSTRIRFTRLG